MLFLRHRDAERERVGKRHVDRGARTDVAVVAELHLRVAADVAEFRLRRLEIDRADGRVAPPQRALRPAQRFDRFQVEQQPRRCFGARRVDAVDEQRDFGIGVLGFRTVVADTAQGQRHDAVVAFGRRREAWHEVREVGDAVDAFLVDQIRIDHADRDRRLLQRRLAFGRGDLDRIEGFRIGAAAGIVGGGVDRGVYCRIDG